LPQGKGNNGKAVQVCRVVVEYTFMTEANSVVHEVNKGEQEALGLPVNGRFGYNILNGEKPCVAYEKHIIDVVYPNNADIPFGVIIPMIDKNGNKCYRQSEETWLEWMLRDK
jgi:hypothetical protein